LDDMQTLYDNPNGNPLFIYLGTVDDAHLYHIVAVQR
jgi:hypothetical protein